MGATETWVSLSIDAPQWLSDERRQPVQQINAGGFGVQGSGESSGRGKTCVDDQTRHRGSWLFGSLYASAAPRAEHETADDADGGDAFAGWPLAQSPPRPGCRGQ